MQSAQKSLARTGASLRASGEEISAIGRGLTAAITAPLLAIGGAALKMSTDFDSALTQVVTLVGLGREEVAGFRKEILELGPALGKSPQELADALFAVTSAGARGAEAMEILGSAAKASAIGLGDTREIALVVGAAVREFGDQNLTAAGAVDTLVGTVEQGNLAAAELAPALGQVLSVAANLGVTFQDTGAFVATFTRSGVSAARAVTGLRSTLQSFLKPTEGTVKALEAMGTSVEAVRASIREDGLIDTLVDLRTQAEGMGVDFSEVIPNVEGLAAVLSVTAGGGREAQEVLAGVEGALGSLNDRLKTTQELDPGFAFKQLKADAAAAAIELGTVLTPVGQSFMKETARPMLESVRGLVKQFSELSPEAQRAGIRMAGIAAAAGPALLVLGGILKVTGGLITGFARLTKGMIALTVVMTTGILPALGTFVAVTTATRALADNFDILTSKVKRFALEFEVSVVSAVQKSLRAVSTFLENVPLIGPSLAGVASAAAAGLEAQVERVETELEKIGPAADRSFVSLNEAFERNVSDLGTVASGVFSDVTDIVVDAATSAGERAGKALTEWLGAGAKEGVEAVERELDKSAKKGDLDAPVKPTVDPKSRALTKETLDALAAPRQAIIEIRERRVKGERELAATETEAQQVAQQLSTLGAGFSLSALQDLQNQIAETFRGKRAELETELKIDEKAAKAEIESILSKAEVNVTPKLAAGSLEALSSEINARELSADVTPRVSPEDAQAFGEALGERGVIVVAKPREDFDRPVLEAIAAIEPNPILIGAGVPEDLGATVKADVDAALSAIGPSSVDVGADTSEVDAAISAIPEPIATRTVRVVIQQVDDPVEVPVRASGSPGLPFSEYFNRFAPAQIRSFVDGASSTPVNFDFSQATSELGRLKSELDQLRGGTFSERARAIPGSPVTLGSTELFREEQRDRARLIDAIRRLEASIGAQGLREVMMGVERGVEQVAQNTRENVSATRDVGRELGGGGFIRKIEQRLSDASGRTVRLG